MSIAVYFSFCSTLYSFATLISPHSGLYLIPYSAVCWSFSYSFAVSLSPPPFIRFFSTLTQSLCHWCARTLNEKKHEAHLATTKATSTSSCARACVCVYVRDEQIVYTSIEPIILQGVAYNRMLVKSFEYTERCCYLCAPGITDRHIETTSTCSLI